MCQPRTSIPCPVSQCLKSTAVVLPPLMTAATRSPVFGWYAPDRSAEIAAAPPGSATTRITSQRTF